MFWENREAPVLNDYVADVKNAEEKQQDRDISDENDLLHEVQNGETLWSISEHYGVSLEALCSRNNKRTIQLRSGELLIIPQGRKWRNESVSRGRNGRFLWPIIGEISSPFGLRWGRIHEGIDIASESGTLVQAAKDGKVTLAGWNGGYGYAVMLEHSQNFQSLYGHLSAVYVQPGEFIHSGQVIGAVGSTGNSTGPHLHFEIRCAGEPLDPLPLLPAL
ncbi:MAG: LysM peptidoglycan-binding domain-containing M23 family metallopeptidase [Sporomusaceae bacterium]|nr:LysM peptidoglycan-binding domain-containing M23 family metallopeptidase [Sporomusaceae bacterium]